MSHVGKKKQWSIFIRSEGYNFKFSFLEISVQVSHDQVVSFPSHSVLCLQTGYGRRQVIKFLHNNVQIVMIYTARFSLHQVYTQQPVHYEVLHRVLLMDTGWCVHGKWGTTRSHSLQCTMVNTTVAFGCALQTHSSKIPLIVLTPNVLQRPFAQ